MRGLNFTKEQADAHQRKHGFSPLSKEDKEALDRSKPKLFRDIKAILRMNKTEAEYALILEAQKRRGEILRYRFEAVKIRVGEGCFYVPDFFIEREGQKPLFVEVKGFLRDDARVKFLAAKEQHSWADFEMWRKVEGSWTQLLYPGIKPTRARRMASKGSLAWLGRKAILIKLNPEYCKLIRQRCDVTPGLALS